MNIGTILFTYHRYEDTKAVIEALSQSDILPDKLYIFQDGIKETTDCSEWQKVNNLISDIHFCETYVHVSEENKGLSRSIVSGINYVFQECDAVIVLEDDCVPHKQFMRYMVSALNKYKNTEKVYSVCGYAWDVELQHQVEDAYFNGKFCSWGWGTWRDRWGEYEENYNILREIKSDSEADNRLNVWGKNMESMLVGNVLNKVDSWAVFMGLLIIKRGGYCLNPHRQLIHNIGFDGSGVHSGIQQDDNENWEDEYKEMFYLPQKVAYTKECEEEFQFLFGGNYGEEKMKLYQDLLVRWIQFKQDGKRIQIPKELGDSIAVYGKGKIFDCLVGEIENSINIKYIIERKPTLEEYRGIPIVSIRYLPNNIKSIIVIPYFDLDIIKVKIKKMRPDIQVLGINELL